MRFPGLVRWRLVLAVVVLAFGLGGNTFSEDYQVALGNSGLSDDAPDGAARVELEAAFGRLPLHFEAHTEPGEFSTWGRGYALLLKPSETIVVLQPIAPDPQSHSDAGEPPSRIRLQFRHEPLPAVLGFHREHFCPIHVGVFEHGRANVVPK